MQFTTFAVLLPFYDTAMKVFVVREGEFILTIPSLPLSSCIQVTQRVHLP
jgi:hypothetical protein